ncbi:MULTISPECIES: hypothetical protein [unclassified Lysinibacillus]|uniref:hypothetical protein n=1 Tax=unclassified Lysinibacillus TaxID=2636778 RepID=UPI00088ACF43|nr:MULTISPECIES: hypothetical protein [unclassified Lysinibacillus]SCY99168.1 Homeodomain-like domain-containing protein [Lysinibacillus sp. SG9]SDB47024.1 Homeodomain-like domain-containing protein [Lysinibacillus sp. TC-37]SFT12476.1 Homeodomain-like domain-containing protein [Lysinibacillus sp. SG55]
MNADMLDKRVSILKKVDDLTNKCNCQAAIEYNHCPNCKQLRKYGDKLMKLLNKRTRMNTSVDIDPIRVSNIPLTKATYLDLKKERKSDSEIAGMLKVSPATIRKWKQLNRITVRLTRKGLKAK